MKGWRRCYSLKGMSLSVCKLRPGHLVSPSIVGEHGLGLNDPDNSVFDICEHCCAVPWSPERRFLACLDTSKLMLTREVRLSGTQLVSCEIVI